jgi:PPE-repeat protein
MDFGARPPETNSGCMYFGPGSGTMQTAAAAWDRLADELHFTAAAYRCVIAELASEGWLGPSSVSMAAALAPFVTWMTKTAEYAEHAARQARAAAAAYEVAFAMVVPPPLIAANRARLVSLAEKCVVGQNAPAIAATEACYEQMWAQDAAAMYRYAASSAAASLVTPFNQPREVTTAGPAAEVAACSLAELSELTSAVPRVLHELAQPWQATSPLSSLPTAPMSLLAVGRESFCGRGAFGAADMTNLTAAPQGPAVSASVGRANSIGQLSVPKAWTTEAIKKGQVTIVWQGKSGCLVSEIWPDEPKALPTGTDGYGGDSAVSHGYRPAFTAVPTARRYA